MVTTAQLIGHADDVIIVVINLVCAIGQAAEQRLFAVLALLQYYWLPKMQVFFAESVMRIVTYSKIRDLNREVE